MTENTDNTNIEHSRNIELRSEKVRNIIGQIPPKIIRTGITVIFIVVVGILTGTYFFEYEYTIETSATIEQRNDTTFIEIKIPANEINKVKQGHKVILSFDNIQNLYNKRIVTEIQEMPNALQISENKGFFTAKVEIVGKLKTVKTETFEIYEKTEVKAEIITNKISFFDRIIKPFKNIMDANK